MSTAIPAPHPTSPPEAWPDDEFDIPPDVGDIVRYSREHRSRSSLATLSSVWESGSDLGRGVGMEEEGEDWGEFDDEPLKGVLGSVTRLGSNPPTPALLHPPSSSSDSVDPDPDFPPSSSPITLALRLPRTVDPEWDDFPEEEDEEGEGGKGDTIKAPEGLGLRGVPVLSPAPTEEDDFESAFLLSPDTAFLALPSPPPLSPAHTGSHAEGQWNMTASTSSTSFSPAPSSLFSAPALSVGTPSTSTSSASSSIRSAADSDAEEQEQGSPVTQHSHIDPDPDLPTLEEGEEDDEADLIFPPDLTASTLRSILARKKAFPSVPPPPLPHSHPLPAPQEEEDDFEHGLLIGEDDDLSPSRLRMRGRRAPGRGGVSGIPAPVVPVPVQVQVVRPPMHAFLSAPPPPTSFHHHHHHGSVSRLPSTSPGGLKHQKSASRLQSPTPSASSASGQSHRLGLGPVSSPGSKPGMRRKASLGTMLPSAAAVLGAGGGGASRTGRGKTGSTSSSDSVTSIPIPPIPGLPTARPPSAASDLPPHPTSSSAGRAKTPSSVGSGGTGSSPSHSLGRLTMPTQSSLAKTQPRSPVPGVGQKKTPVRQRGALAGIFPHVAVGPSSPASTKSSPVHQPSPPQQQQAPRQAEAKLLRRPRGMERRGRGDVWGTGRELDGIEDLPVGKEESVSGGGWKGTVGRFKGGKRGVSPVPRLGTSVVSSRAPASLGSKRPRPTSFIELSSHQFQQQQSSSSSATISHHPPSAYQQQLQPQHQPQAPKRSRSRDEIQLEKEQEKEKARKDSAGRSRSRGGAGKREKENGRGRKGPTLIRDLGSVGLPKTLNGMRWNPAKHRWDGQEDILKLFDPPSAPSRPARPALITHFSGAQGHSPLLKSLGLGASTATSVGIGGGGVRVVGEMMFDPVQMRWLRRDGAEEEDVFRGVDDSSSASGELEELEVDAMLSLADGESGNAGAGGTIRARNAGVQVLVHGPAANVDPELVTRCHEAETRHRAELRGWLGGMSSPSPTSSSGGSAEDGEGEEGEGRRWLWEIRKLATTTEYAASS